MLSKCGLGIVHEEIVYITIQSAKVLVHAFAGWMKLLRGPDPARGPYVGHPCAKGYWIRLLNVSYPRLEPEIFVILTQESATATDSVPPSPLIQPDHSVPQVHTQARLPGIALDTKHGYFVQFILANPNSSFLKYTFKYQPKFTHIP